MSDNNNNNDGRIVEQHIPCPHCKSSDAYCVYDDGHGYCFSCKTYDKSEKADLENLEVGYTYHPWRGISSETMEKYNVKTKIVGEVPTVIGFGFPKGSFQIRTVASKKFYSTGNKMSEEGLYGTNFFPAGSAKAITITEGPTDALSVYEMLGDYPVVAVKSASTAKQDCVKDLKYLNSFERIYLCFDNDEPGRKAAKEVASLFDFNKVYNVNLTKYNDANEFLAEGEGKAFQRVWYNAKKFLPDGIVSSFSEIGKMIMSEESKQSSPFPWRQLNEMTYGIRTGEVTLITAQEGIGKTEITGAIEHHILQTEPEEVNIGVIHLEETKEQAAKRFATLSLGVPCHLPDTQVSKEEIFEHYKRAVKKDDRVHIYTHFGSDDPDVILGAIRFLVASCGCKYIFLDHITMIVTGLADNDERKTLDIVSTKLAMMVKELDFALVLVSHINDDGLTRGSRNISKIASTHIRLDRDLDSPIPDVRNTTKLTVKKNRFAGRTGPAGSLLFDENSFSLREIQQVDPDGLPPIEEE